jgi:sugar lactone lactonase YvrE
MRRKPWYLSSFVVLVGLLGSGTAAGQSLLTAAGKRLDNIYATAVPIAIPTSIAVTPNGDVFFTDDHHFRVMRVALATGFLSTYAGNGLAGNGTPGVPASQQSIGYPRGLAADAKGDLYVATGGRILKIAAGTALLSIVADGPSVAGLAVDGSGNLYAGCNDSTVRKISPDGTSRIVAGTGQKGFSGDGGPATAAQLDLSSFSAGDLALDGQGNVVISDRGNRRLRRVSPDGIIRTIAGNGQTGHAGDGGPATLASLQNPAGVAIDGQGNVFVASGWEMIGTESSSGRVRMISPAGIITTVAGGGFSNADGIPAVEANITGASGIALTSSGDLLISAANEMSRVRRLSRATGRIDTVAGTNDRNLQDGSPSTAVHLAYPRGLAFDASGNLVIADPVDFLVRRVSHATGKIETVTGGGTRDPFDTPVPAAEARFNSGPATVAFDPRGNLFVGLSGTALVYKISAETGLVSRFAGWCCGEMSGGGIPGPALSAQIAPPFGIAVDASGNVFLTSNGLLRVRPDGIIEWVVGGGTKAAGDGVAGTEVGWIGTEGVTIGPGGEPYFAEYNNRVWRVSNGVLRLVAGTGQAGFSGDGGPATAAQLSHPTGIVFDGTGNLLIADGQNARVRRVGKDGIISTILGNGTLDGAGDGTAATSAALGVPQALAIDGAGTLAVSTALDGRVRAVFPCTTPARPQAVGPAQTADYLRTDLVWTPSRATFSYDVRLDTKNPPLQVVASNVPYSTATPFWIADDARQSTSVSNLLPGTTYYWQTIARGDASCAGLPPSASPILSFTTTRPCTEPGAFAVVAPSPGSTVAGSATTLTWSAADGAAFSDVYFGKTNPPALYRSGVSATSVDVSGLTPSSTYWWYVVAFASCDQTRATATPASSFLTAGPCADPGTFSLVSPAPGASVSAPVTLTWTAAANVATYDVYFGRSAAPPLYQAGVTGTVLAIPGLATGATYWWNVVARSGCDPAKTVPSPVRSFTVSGTCGTPAAPSFTFFPPGKVATGQSYVLVWSPVALGPGGAYLVERSRSALFAPVLDSSITTGTSAAFVPSTTGVYYHRVLAVAGCDPSRRSPASATATVEAIDGTPVVIFTRPPRGLVAPLGPSLDASLDTVDADRGGRNFTIQNLSSRPVNAFVTTNPLAPSPPFFRVDDPKGESTVAGLLLAPNETRTLTVTYSGIVPTTPASFQGVLYLFTAGAEIVSYAFVNLKVGGEPAALPELRINGTAAEYAAFPGLPSSVDDATRSSLSVDVYNPGPGAMELAAEIGPEVWLEPLPGWNDTPIPPGASRSVQLRTRRNRALSGSAFPRYTYFTVRTRNGATARLMVQDSDLPVQAQDPRSALPPGTPSFIVPSVVHATSKIGSTFVSRLRLSNAASDDIQVELVFTPAGVDGFDTGAVRRLKLTVPRNDVVSLTDPLVQLFGLTPPAVGQLEVRADPSRLGALTVTSGVDAPAKAGGTFGFQLPILRRGDGASLGQPQIIPAITLDATYRSNVILAETTGRDGASVTVSLFDAGGTKLGEKLVDVRRYGQAQFALSDLLGQAQSLTAGLVEISVTSGGGSVGAVVTVIDNVNDDSSTYVSRPAAPAAPGAALVARFGKARLSATATSAVRLGVPAVVNGYSTFPGSVLPYTFQTQMVFTSGTQLPATFTLTYTDLAQGSTKITRSLTVPGRGSRTYDNVLEQLFGIPPGQKSQGPVLVDASANGSLTARVYSRLENGTLGDSFPVITLPPQSVEQLTGASAAHPLALDGLEQSIDASRGTRSNLILNEWTGQSATVTVRLYEAGNRSRPIAEEDVTLAPWEKKQLSNVFSGLGLETDEKRKDRANVLCVVTPKAGGGLVSGVVTTIDNKTGDTRNSVLSPAGATQGGGVIGF